MKLESAAFLRQIGMPEDHVTWLVSGEKVTVTGHALLTWLRSAYAEGRKSTREGFVWRSVDELFEDREA